MKIKKKLVLVVLVTMSLTIIFCYLMADTLLLGMGRLLAYTEAPKISDVIVPLRGYEDYYRVLEAAHIFKKKYAKYVYLSSGLLDNIKSNLKRYDVSVPSEKDRLVSILAQMGIPHGRVIIDEQKPGGGTIGEIRRIKSMMDTRGFRTAILVTNWWHTNRVRMVCNRIIGNTSKVAVVAVSKDKTRPDNWWQYRYDMINVVLEFPKIVMEYLFKLDFTFADDSKIQFE